MSHAASVTKQLAFRRAQLKGYKVYRKEFVKRIAKTTPGDRPTPETVYDHLLIIRNRVRKAQFKKDLITLIKVFGILIAFLLIIGSAFKQSVG